MGRKSGKPKEEPRPSSSTWTIEAQTLASTYFRQVLFTAQHVLRVAMCLQQLKVGRRETVVGLAAVLVIAFGIGFRDRSRPLP